MTTTISKHVRQSHRRKTGRPPSPGYADANTNEEVWPGSVAPSLDETLRDETASSRTAFVSGVRDIVPVLLALIPLAVAFGATAVGSGLSALETLGMSVFVLGGAAQLAMVPLISAGASVAVIVLTVLVINLRMVLYSASLAPHFRGLSGPWKILISYHLTDPSYAATITRFDEGKVKGPDRRWYYLGVALAIWVTWQAASMLGVLVGSRASEGWSLDFVLPLTFIALAVPAVKNRTSGAAALASGTTAVFVAAMPLNLGLITAALVGVFAGLIAESAVERSKK